jgi:hypothetical protein
MKPYLFKHFVNFEDVHHEMEIKISKVEYIEPKFAHKYMMKLV